MDVNAIARDLVAAMSDAVAKHAHPRSGLLVPPRLTGRTPVKDPKAGERVIDRADELLGDASEEWLPSGDPDVFLELVMDGSTWTVAWTIDSEGSAENGSSAAEDDALDSRQPTADSQGLARKRS